MNKYPEVEEDVIYLSNNDNLHLTGNMNVSVGCCVLVKYLGIYVFLKTFTFNRLSLIQLKVFCV